MIRYAMLLFMAIATLAGILSYILLNFAADRFESYELQTVEAGMQLAVDDLENQYEVLTDIVHKIQVTSYYQPNIVRMDAYRDIELLKDFVYFKNFSPLLNRYFLIYPDLFSPQQKAFTSDGQTSYFPFYCRTLFGLSSEESDGLYQHIIGVRSRECLMLGDHALLIFPIRFLETQLPDSRAVMTFVLPVKEVQARMRQMAANLPGRFALTVGSIALHRYQDGRIEPLSQLGKLTQEQGTRLLTVHAKEQLLELSACVPDDKWALLHSSLPGWIFAGFALCLVLVAAVSVLLTRVFAKPLRNLINQHTPPGERFRNEFVQLEELVSKMERENGNSMRQLRSRTLLTMLRGYYSEGLMKRWGFLSLDLHWPYYCVAVIAAPPLEEDEARRRIECVESLTDHSAGFLAVHIPEDRVIAVITGFGTAEDGEAAYQCLQRLAQDWGAVCSPGKTCDTPQRLSISYMEAMTAHLRNLKWQSENLTGMHTFAIQLVTAAERGDEEGMRQLCEQFTRQIQDTDASRTLIASIAAQLMTELGVLAGERHVVLDRQRVGMLTLLPSLPLLLKDTCDLVRDTFYQEQEEYLSRADGIAQAIVEYVQENAFDADFDLSRIAECFGLSNDYISMMIKKVTGTAFKEYLTELRLERARTLLRERPDLTVNDISLQVGYRKTSNFIRKFKEKYGYTPAQYRQPAQ